MSPLLYGRVDVERYKQSLATCQNYIPTIQGGLPRRPGTVFVAEVKDSSKKVRLERFEFSTTQAYIIEFGNLYVRFYRDNAPVLETTKTITGITQANPAVVTSNAHGFSNGDEVYITGIVGMTILNGRNFKVANVTANTFSLTYMDGTAVNSTAFTAWSSGGTAARVYTLTTTYLEAHLFDLKVTQSADVLYIVHPSYPPRKLTRTAHTSWTITTIELIDGPYLPEDSSGITITPSATTGNITLTASSALWVSTDVGRLVRLKHGSTTWGTAKITGYTSTTVVNANVGTGRPFGATTASLAFRLGVWSDTTGYPGCVVFHEDRLCFAGAPNVPQRFDASNTSDYEDFGPTETNGTVLASNALSFSLNSNDVNLIRWMTSDEKGLLAGSVGGEWVIRPSSSGEALSPTNVSAKRATSYGSANIQPVQVGKASLFVQRARKTIRELTYFYDVDGFRANDMTQLSNHIAGSGFVQLAYQKEPQSLVWGVRSDGVLSCMNYERDVESLKVGWSRHVIGGASDAAGTAAVVESIAVIPSPDGSREDVWLTVKRYVNGGTKRYVEYMSKFFDDSDAQEDAFFVDAGLTLDSPKTITGITKANPAVVTSAAHGFSNGDTVTIREVVGMTEVNDKVFTIANKTADTFQLEDENSTSYTTYVSGGEVRKRVTAVSGLSHLEGQTVHILGDGAKQPPRVVSSGAITLQTPAAVVHAGLQIVARGKLLRLEAGAADGTALGKTRRTHRCGFLLHRTLGFKVGTSFDALDEVTFRTSSDAMGHAPELFSGIVSQTLEAGYDFDNEICFEQSDPLPGMVLAIMPQMVTQDRG